MSNAPQVQKSQDQNAQASNQNQGKAASADTSMKKDEKTAQTGQDNMKNEGGCSSSDKKAM